MDHEIKVDFKVKAAQVFNQVAPPEERPVTSIDDNDTPPEDEQAECRTPTQPT